MGNSKIGDRFSTANVRDLIRIMNYLSEVPLSHKTQISKDACVSGSHISSAIKFLVDYEFIKCEYKPLPKTRGGASKYYSLNKKVRKLHYYANNNQSNTSK